MKIAYGTYAMPATPLEEAIPTLAGIGYEGIEICIGPKHTGSLPEEMDAARRGHLRNLLRRHGMGVPALFVVGSLYTPGAAEFHANCDLLRRCAQLARDLGVETPPVLAMGIGGRTQQWEEIRGDMARVLRDYAALAEAEDFVLAGEAHCGAAVDRSERVTWLLDTVDHLRVRFHFDIVHMFLSGEDVAESVRKLVPYTAHTHITDARRYPDGKFDLVLLGDGDLDSTAYVRAMHAAGWKSFITLEVSVRVWGKPDYDAVAAARQCYAALTGAFEKAGVPRG